MDRSELVRKFEIIDKLMESVKGRLSGSKLELNDDGYYSVENIDDESAKKYASLYNKMADIKKKGIANLTEEDKIFLRDLEGLKNLANYNGITDFDTKTKSYSFEELMEEIIKLNPEVQLAYDKESVANRAIYCSVAGDKLNLPKGYYYNAKNGITNKHTTSTGAYTSNSVFDISKAPSDAIKVNVEDKEDKKEETTEEKKETPKESTEGKKEVKRGSFGEVVSCLVGQVDKRLYNFGKKYSSLSIYLKPAIVSSILIATAAIPVGGFGLLALGGVFAGAVTAGLAVNDIVKIKKNPTIIVGLKEIAKGSYLENIKNAWTKFRKSKQKTNEVKKTNVAVNPTKTEVKEDDTSKKKQEMINKVREILVSMNYDSFRENISNLKFVRNCYSQVENELDKECKDKYAFWNGILEYVEGLSKAVSDKDKAKANFYYERLLNVCGESDNLKKIITVEVLNAYNELLKEVKTETDKKVEENKVEDVINPYIQSLLQQMYVYNLVTTKESVKTCEKLLSEIDSKIPETSNIRKNSKYNGLWKKYDYLKKSLIIKNKVLAFVEKVQNIKKSKDVTYDEFKECMSIVNNFSETEWKEFDSLSNATAILSDFQAILRNSRELILNQKLEELDIDKCVNENNYQQLVELVKIADDYEKEAKDKHKALPVNKLSEVNRLKLEKVREIVKSFSKFNEYKLDVSLIVNQDDSSIKAHYVNYEGEEIELILDTKFTGSIEEVTKNVINEINAIEPLVDIDRINIQGIKYVKGTSKGSHR